MTRVVRLTEGKGSNTLEIGVQMWYGAYWHWSVQASHDTHLDFYGKLSLPFHDLDINALVLLLRTPASWGLAHALAVRPWHTGQLFVSSYAVVLLPLDLMS